MKNISNIITCLVLLLNSMTIFGQEKNLETETAFMDCFYQSLPDKGVQFMTMLKKAEQKLIDKKILKDGTGESYVGLYKNLEKVIDEDLQDLGVTNYMQEIMGTIDNSSGVDCIENVFTSPTYQNSKFSQMISLSQSSNQEIQDYPSFINSILAILNAKDFEHHYYKMTTFIMIETMNYVDLSFVPKLPEIAEEKISDEERARAFKIEIQSEEVILINGKESTVKIVKNELKSYLQNTRSESIIILKSNPSAPYILFINTQNEMVAAFEEVRNELAKEKFKRSFDELNQEQQEEIKKIYPLKIVDQE